MERRFGLMRLLFNPTARYYLWTTRSISFDYLPTFATFKFRNTVVDSPPSYPLGPGFQRSQKISDDTANFPLKGSVAQSHHWLKWTAELGNLVRLIAIGIKFLFLVQYEINYPIKMVVI